MRVRGQREGAGEGEGHLGAGGCGGLCAVSSGGGESEAEEHAGVFGLVRGASAHDEEAGREWGLIGLLKGVLSC